MENLINIYVVWSYDGPIMTTLLQYEESDTQRQAMQQWSTEDYIAQAYDVEFGEAYDGAGYELAAIFEAPKLTFIY